jgi:hypothetical protein
MASSRGFLNIQSLNELTYEKRNLAFKPVSHPFKHIFRQMRGDPRFQYKPGLQYLANHKAACSGICQGS